MRCATDPSVMLTDLKLLYLQTNYILRNIMIKQKRSLIKIYVYILLHFI